MENNQIKNLKKAIKSSKKYPKKNTNSLILS